VSGIPTCGTSEASTALSGVGFALTFKKAMLRMGSEPAIWQQRIEAEQIIGR
jgi:hypothetical protein